MATRLFADEELERLREFPDITRDELYRFFTLTPADLAFIAPQGRGAGVRLGLAVTVCALPWLGFVPDNVAGAPAVVVARLADRLGVDAALIRPPTCSHPINGRRNATNSAVSWVNPPTPATPWAR